MKIDFMKNFEKISNKLNELLIKNYDAEQGYIKAMHNVENDRLKSFFTERSEDRGRFASQIRTQILLFGETPKESGSFTGTMHRNWMDFKTLFTSNDEKVILEEILRGEKASLEDYNEIISETDIPENIKTVLVSHRNSIKNVINNVPKLEEAVA
jgi:uncharacterized protein (TIGR02284 family)